MKIKRFIPIILLTLLMTMLYSCKDTQGNGAGTGTAAPSTGAETTADVTTEAVTTAAPTDYTEKTLSFAELEGKYKLYGRSMKLDDSITCDWSASGIEFNIDCRGSITLNVTPARACFLTVFLDGEKVGERIKTPASKGDVVILSDIPEGVHNVLVLKSTIVASGNTPYSLALNSMTFTGELLERPEDREYFIEIIGDSITAGSGVRGIDAKTNSPQYGDGTASYAYLTAEALDVDFSIVGVGGAGVVKSYNDAILPNVYPYTSWHRDKTALYDFPRKANLVVINLGTNDSGLGTTETEFEEGLEAFIKVVLEKHNNPKIVLAYGIMNSSFAKQMQNVVNKLGGEEAGFYLVRLPEGRSGGGNHPNAEQQAAAAEVLTEFIKKIGIER